MAPSFHTEADKRSILISCQHLPPQNETFASRFYQLQCWLIYTNIFYKY